MSNNCPYPTTAKTCIRNFLGSCCCECERKDVCLDACKNKPELCGRDLERKPKPKKGEGKE